MRPLWQGAGTMVFNGDTVNVVVADDGGRDRGVLSHLSRLCGEDGVEAVFLAGNCDFDLPGERHLELAGGKVLVTHGEAIFRGVCPWRDVAPRVVSAKASALEQMPRDRRETLAGQLEAIRLSLTAVRDPMRMLLPWWLKLTRRILYARSAPRRAWAMLRAWREAPSLAGRFFAEYAPQAKVIVIGHTHRAGVWDLGGRSLINTGSLSGPGRALTVRLEDRQVTVRRIRRGREGWQPGETVASLSV